MYRLERVIISAFLIVIIQRYLGGDTNDKNDENRDIDVNFEHDEKYTILESKEHHSFGSHFGVNMVINTLKLYAVHLCIVEEKGQTEYIF